MTNAILEKFKDAVDAEIKEYEAMDELYKLKQAILIQGKSDALWDVDAKIVDKIGTIKSATQKRREAAKYLGDENLSMSLVIEKAKNMNDPLLKNLQEQSTKLNLLTKSLSLQEKTNMELIKHGLTMAEKTLGIIFSVVSPLPSEYDKSGRNIENTKERISSVIEEA